MTPELYEDQMTGSAEPLQKTRPITGQVLPLPCASESCPNYTLIGPDGEPDLHDVLSLYRGCVVSITIELVEGRKL